MPTVFERFTILALAAIVLLSSAPVDCMADERVQTTIHLGQYRVTLVFHNRTLFDVQIEKFVGRWQSVWYWRNPPRRRR